jgi:hypothetical protein
LQNLEAFGVLLNETYRPYRGTARILCDVLPPRVVRWKVAAAP